jgi:hypothetical protein
MSNHQWGVKWSEFGKGDRLVQRKRFFNSEAALDRFVAQVEEKHNFNRFEAWLEQGWD